MYMYMHNLANFVLNLVLSLLTLETAKHPRPPRTLGRQTRTPMAKDKPLVTVKLLRTTGFAATSLGERVCMHYDGIL